MILQIGAIALGCSAIIGVGIAVGLGGLKPEDLKVTVPTVAAIFVALFCPSPWQKKLLGMLEQMMTDRLKSIMAEMQKQQGVPQGEIPDEAKTNKYTGESSMLKGPPILTVAALAVLAFGCGPSPWITGIKYAEKIQEESDIKQKEETDALLKTGWFLCNGWSARYTASAQGVLNARAEVARGDVGAETKLGKAVALTAIHHGIFVGYCGMAKQTSVLIKGQTPVEATPAIGVHSSATVAPPAQPAQPVASPPPPPASPASPVLPAPPPAPSGSP